jgi:hypothetical protein
LSTDLLAALIGVGAAAGTRSSLTVLALALAARFTGFELTSELAVLTTDLGLALLVAFAVLDEVVERDADLQGALVLANVAIRGAGGVVAAWGLQDGTHASLPQPVAWAIGGAMAIAVHLVRTKVQAHVPATGGGLLDPRSWLGWLESGGVIALVIAVVLAPMLALGFVVVATLGSLGILLAARGLERGRHRRPCAHCGQQARVEASRCPRCLQALPIVRWLRSGA